jgi:hypothetical protein
MKKLAVMALAVFTSCSPGAVTPTPTAGTPAPTPPQISSAPPTPPIRGSVFSMPAEADMITFHADGTALVTTTTKGTPPPYDSKILRAEVPTGPWKLVYESDAMFMVDRVSSGRIAFIEYREPYQGGGAYSNVFVVLDLARGDKKEIDRFALSAATYRGGGGAPRRPVGAMALGPDHVAWTRLIEGPGGSITGELRMASLLDPVRSDVVATSAEWLRPIDLDEHRLVYVVGGKTEDALHVRDVVTGADRVALTGPVGDTVRGEIPAFDQAAVSGDWAVWMVDPKTITSKGQAFNLRTGERRDLEVKGSSCYGVSAGARYFVWGCGKPNDPTDALVIDAKSLAPVAPVPPAVGVDLAASGDGLLWLNVSGSSRTVTLFRP